MFPPKDGELLFSTIDFSLWIMYSEFCIQYIIFYQALSRKRKRVL
jgi:hypothetical protein